MAFWDGDAWNAISGAVSWLGKTASESLDWMDNHKNATNILGNVMLGAGQYFAQKEANKSLMKQQRELLDMQSQLKSQYSAVPDSDWSYKSLTVDDSPGLANGGILTEMKKDVDRKRNGG